MGRAELEASQSLTDHLHCLCHHLCGCSAAGVPRGWELGSASGAEPALAVLLISEREAARGLADFFPSPHGFAGARWCIGTHVDFLAFPPSCVHKIACGVEVSNPHLLRGCKETDGEKLLGI